MILSYLETLQDAECDATLHDLEGRSLRGKSLKGKS